MHRHKADELLQQNAEVRCSPLPPAWHRLINDEANDMADEKQMKAIRNFCAKPFSQHGAKRTSGKGRFPHDWSDLVEQISYFDYGHTQKDEAKVQAIGKRVRAEFPNPNSIANGSEWDQMVNAPDAHERILEIIRTGLVAAFGARPENNTE
jgi:hypothetical protein